MKHTEETKKKPILDPKLRYRIELLIILLVVSVLLNVGIYYYNLQYDAENFSEPPVPAPASSMESPSQ